MKAWWLWTLLALVIGLIGFYALIVEPLESNHGIRSSFMTEVRSLRNLFIQMLPGTSCRYNGKVYERGEEVGPHAFCDNGIITVMPVD